MDWEAIGAIGETLGAIGVLISLIFVGLQVRQSAAQTEKSNALARADMTERAMRTFGDTVIEIARNPELAVAFRKVMIKPAELTDGELTSVLTFFNVWLHRHRTAFLSVSDGLIDAQVMIDFDSSTKWYLTSPLFKDEWLRTKSTGTFTGKFSEHIDRLMP